MVLKQFRHTHMEAKTTKNVFNKYDPTYYNYRVKNF